METYVNALLVAIPMFFVLLIGEVLYGHFKKNQTHYALDTISSLSSGLTNLIKDSFGVVLVIISYPFLLKHLASFDLKGGWPVFLVGFIAIDFASYWVHRLSHKVNYFWNRHVVHHSSEEFNLGCALRQSISTMLGIYPIFLIPAAIMGVPGQVIATIAPIHLFMQFWYHTQHIPKLGFLEYLIVTPSQHRVHHAINPEYIDKNLAPIFCVWDRVFGTFQEELDDVPPVYGVLKPVHTWNPIRINFQHLWNLITDAWNTKSWKAKLMIWFKPTGWRPEDVKEKYTFRRIDDVYNFEKYRTEASKAFVFWAGFHLLMVNLMLLHMLANFASLETAELWLYGGIIFLTIYGYTSLMDRTQNAMWLELLCSLAGIAVIVTTGDWFAIGEQIPFGTEIVLGYFLLTILGAGYFTIYERAGIAREEFVPGK